MGSPKLSQSLNQNLRLSRSPNPNLSPSPNMNLSLSQNHQQVLPRLLRRKVPLRPRSVLACRQTRAFTTTQGFMGHGAQPQVQQVAALVRCADGKESPSEPSR